MVVSSGNKSVVRTPLKGPSLRFLTHSLALTLTLSKFLRFSQLATFIKCAKRRVFIHLTEEFNQSLVSQAFLIFPNIFISQVSIPPPSNGKLSPRVSIYGPTIAGMLTPLQGSMLKVITLNPGFRGISQPQYHPQLCFTLHLHRECSDGIRRCAFKLR